MKCLILITTFFSFLFTFISSTFLEEQTYINEFIHFIEKYEKKYTDDEFPIRYNIFKDNVDKIEKHNSENHGWSMKINKFADQTWHEVKQNLSGYKKTNKNYHTQFTNNILPSSFDWVEKGAVTPVKNQGHCGSCYSFSTTGAIEGAWFINTGNLVSLSEQQIVDCSKNYGNNGCNGGLMDNGFKYVLDNGLCSEKSYKYEAKDSVCNLCSSSTVNKTCNICKEIVYITDYKDVEPNEEALQQALFLQPISIAVEADQTGWQFYHNGVMTSNCGTNLDHGVLLVGWGELNNVPYWKVKNSWGEDWGENGYILLERNVSSTYGQCGIAMQASYPIVNVANYTINFF